MQSLYQFLRSAKKSQAKVFLGGVSVGILSGVVVELNADFVKLTGAMFLYPGIQWFKADTDVTVAISQVSFWSEKDIRPLV